MESIAETHTHSSGVEGRDGDGVGNNSNRERDGLASKPRLSLIKKPAVDELQNE